MQGFANMVKSGNWNSPVNYIDSTLYIHTMQIFTRNMTENKQVMMLIYLN